MPTIRWDDTIWSNANRLEPKTRKQRRAARVEAKEEYRRGVTALNVGAPTLNEEALLSLGMRAMFEIPKGPDDHVTGGVDAGIEAIEKALAGLPVNTDVFLKKLEEAWKRGYEERVRREEKRLQIKRQKLRHADLATRFKERNRARFYREVRKAGFRLRKSEFAPNMIVIVGAPDAKIEVDDDPPQALRIRSGFCSLAKEVDVHRFGKGTLILGRCEERGPQSFYILAQSRGTKLKVVVGRPNPNKSDQYLHIADVPYGSGIHV